MYIRACSQTTFVTHFLKKTPAFVPGASSSSAVNTTQTDREDMSSFEEEEEGLRVINRVKLNVSSAPSSTAHFISCTPVWRTRIHLSGPRRLHLKKTTGPVPRQRLPPRLASISCRVVICKHPSLPLSPRQQDTQERN